MSWKQRAFLLRGKPYRLCLDAGLDLPINQLNLQLMMTLDLSSQHIYALTAYAFLSYLTIKPKSHKACSAVLCTAPVLSWIARVSRERRRYSISITNTRTS